MFDVLKSLHLLALLLGGGSSVGGFILMRQVARSGQPPTPVVMQTAAEFGRAGLAAIVLLWLTGVPMAVMTDAFATAGMAFNAKLLFATLVLALVIVMTRLRMRAAQVGGPGAAKLIAQLAVIVRVSTVLAVVLAVIAFN